MARNTKIDATLLKNMRKEANYTQQELATRIGISRETVSAIENAKIETLNNISAEVISAWHIACRQGATSDTKTKFLSHMMKYLGFSEQNIINMGKQLSGSDKQK